MTAGAADGLRRSYLWWRHSANPVVRVALAVLVVVLVTTALAAVSNAIRGQRVDTASPSYQAGEANGSEYEQTYQATHAGVPADVGTPCQTMFALAEQNGYTFSAGQVTAGHVNRTAFLAGCRAGFGGP